MEKIMRENGTLKTTMSWRHKGHQWFFMACCLHKKSCCKKFQGNREL